MQRKILVIQHDEDVPLGNFYDWILEFDKNIVFDIVNARKDKIPFDYNCPVIILGGENNAYDDLPKDGHISCPWLGAEKKLISSLVRNNVPVLGICLGFQLGTVALGGKVEVAHSRGREFGGTRLYLSALADLDPVFSPACKYFKSSDIFVTEFHSDCVVSLPEGARILASSDKYIQSLRCGSFIGVQFHPEANFDSVSNWATNYADKHSIIASFVDNKDCIEKFAKFIAQGFISECTHFWDLQ